MTDQMVSNMSVAVITIAFFALVGFFVWVNRR